MARWVQIAIVLCLVAITGLLGVIAHAMLSAEPDLETQIVARDLRVRVGAIGNLQNLHAEITGGYARTYLDLEERFVSNPTRDWFEMATGTHLNVSLSGRAVLISAPREAEGSVECAQLFSRDEEVGLHSLISDPGPWDVEPNGEIRCRQTGVIWSLLHRIGLGDLGSESGVSP